MLPPSPKEQPSNNKNSDPNWAGVFAYGLVFSLLLLAITPLMSILI
jgi:hypothetical protein